MRIRLSLSDTPHRDTLTVFADPKEAKDDQTIMGSRWECPGDLDVGYAMIDNRETIVDELQGAGYVIASGALDVLRNPPIKSCQKARCNDPHCPWKDA